MSDSVPSREECTIVRHFRDNYSRTDSGRFVVPLPKKPDAKAIGESRSQAVRRFLSLERLFHAKNQFDEFGSVMKEYFDMGHAEPVPLSDLEKPQHQVFTYPCTPSTRTRALPQKSEQCSMHLLNPHLVCHSMTPC